VLFKPFSGRGKSIGICQIASYGTNETHGVQYALLLMLKQESIPPAAFDPGAVFLPRIQVELSPEEDLLVRRIVPEKLPRHMAVIMDGNGRWARSRGFGDRIKGHEAGIESVRSAVHGSGELGVKALTLYAFSVENWQRPKAEIHALMGLLDHFLKQELNDLHRYKVKLVASGRLGDLPANIRKTLDYTIAETAANTGLVLNLALSYGGRTEILEAVRTIAEQAARGELDPARLSEELFASYLYHPELGDPDLLIRTSGEMRVSNFLLWQIAYAEIHITPTLWPDFRRRELYTAILDYQKRERRFGKVLSAK